MVNKVALGILAVIILTAMTIGGLVGLQMSGAGGSDAGTQTPASTPNPQPATATPATTATGDDGSDDESPTPTSTPVVPPSDIDRSLVEEEVRVAINERRADRDMQALRTDDLIHEMARNHSRSMAQQGYVAHGANGLSTEDRYEAFDLADRCRIPDNSNRGIESGQALEAISKTNIGATYTFEGTDRTIQVQNETQMARVFVDTWFSIENERRKLLLEQAAVVGVGVAVTEEGDVYVTTDLC